MATYVKFGPQPPRAGFITKTRVSSVTGGTAFNVPHGGPTGQSPDRITIEGYTRPDTPCAWSMHRVPASDSTTNDTLNIVIDAETGGSLTGAVFDIFFHFDEVAGGGIS